MEEKNEIINEKHFSTKNIIFFILRLIMIIGISYVYVVGMIEITTINTKSPSPLLVGTIRGILIYLHIDLNFYIVKHFFQNQFPFNNYVGYFVAVISWLTGYLLFVLFD